MRSTMAGTTRMDEFDWVPIGAWGGILAALAVAGQVVARGIGWLLNWNDRRDVDRTTLLNTREELIHAREEAYSEKVERRFSEFETKIYNLSNSLAALRLKFTKLRTSLVEVTVELKVHSPTSEALVRAEEHLRETYPEYTGAADHSTPEELRDLLRKLDEG